MSYEFGVNTDLLDTNVVNLCFVARVTVNVLNENMGSILDQRKKKILLILEISDKEINNAAETLAKAKQVVEIALRTSEELRAQSIELITQEGATESKKLDIDMQRLLDETHQLIESKKCQILQIVARYHFSHLIERAEHILLRTFMPQNTSETSIIKHTKLNVANRKRFSQIFYS